MFVAYSVAVRSAIADMALLALPQVSGVQCVLRVAERASFTRQCGRTLVQEFDNSGARAWV